MSRRSRPGDVAGQTSWREWRHSQYRPCPQCRDVGPHLNNVIMQYFNNQAVISKQVGSLKQQAWLVVVILQDSGIRPDEAFPMRIENIYWDQNRIWVPEGKTDNATRFVPMSDRMKTMLQAGAD